MAGLLYNINKGILHKLFIVSIFIFASVISVMGQCPTAVSAGGNATICETDTYSPTGTATDADTYLWTSSGTAGTLINETTLTPTYTPSAADIAAGNVTLTLTASRIACADGVDQMILTIVRLATVTAPADETICATDFASLVGTATDYDLALIQWTTNGTGSFGSSTALSSTYTLSAADIAAGNVTLTLSVTGNAPCSNIITDNLVLTIQPEPTTNAGADQTICSNSSASLSATAANYDNTSILWSAAGGGTFSSTSILNPTFTPTASQISTGFADLTIYVDGLGVCSATVSDVIRIFITDAPTVDAGSASATICEGDTYTLGGSATNYTALLWNNNGGDGSFNDATLANAIYTPGATDISNGTVTLTLSASPIAPCAGSATDNLILNITTAPVVNAGSNITICANDAPTLGAGVTGSYTNITWTSSNGGTFSNSTLTPQYFPSAAEIAAGTSTITLTVTGNAPCNNTYSNSFIVSITDLPTIAAGADQIICDLLPISLTAIATNYDGGTIAWSGGNGIFSSASSLSTNYTPNAADLAAGTVTLTIQVDGQNPCNTTVNDQLTLTLYDAVTVNAGADDDICNATYNLDATTTYASTFLWTTSGTGNFSSGGTIEDPIYTASAADILAGSVILTLTVQPIAPCSVAASDDLQLTFVTSPTADAGANDVVCETSPNYTLSGVTTGPGTALWTTSGSGTFDDDTDVNATYSPSVADIAAGSVILTLTATNSVCIDVDQMTLTIQPEAAVDAGNNQNICTTDVVNITTATQSNTSLLTWSSSGSGTFSNINALNPTYFPTAADYLLSGVRLTITGSASGPCAINASDFMDVTFVDPPTAVAGLDATICETSTFTFTTSSFTNAASITWTSSGDGTFNDDGIQYPTYTPGSNDRITGSATLTLTADPFLGCSAPVTSSMVLTLEAAPSADAGVAMTICEGGTVNLTTAIASDYASLLWTSSGTGSFTNDAALNPVYTPSVDDIAAGSITLTLTANNNAPCAVPAVSNINVTITPLPEVYAGIDDIICESGNYTLGATAANYSSVIWTTSGNGTFSNENDVNTSYTPSSADINLGSVTLTLTVFGELPECTGFVSDAMVLTFQELPTVVAGIDAAICEGSTYTSNPTVTDASSVAWSTTGDGIFANSALPNTVYTPGTNDIINGTVDLTLLVNGTSPCASTASSTLTLTILNNPSVNAGSNETICEGAFLVQNAVVTDHSTLLWTSSGSSGTLANQTTLTPTYTPSAADIVAGFVDLTLTANPNSPCATPTSDIIRLTIEENPTANAGADATVCESGSHTVIGATVANQSTYLWSSSGTGTLINNVNSLTPNYTPSPADLLAGSVTLTITVQPNAPCGIVATDDMLLTFEPLPVVEAGSSATICEGNSYTIIDAVVTNSVSLLWTSSGTGTFTDNSVLNATYNPSAADISTGSVQLTLTAASNAPCISSISDVMDLTIQHLPTANAGTDPTICEGDSYVVSTASATNYSSVSWTSNGTGTFLNGTSLTPSFIPSAADILAGTVTLTLTANSTSPCISTATDAMIITIDPSPAIYAGADQTLCENTIYTINDATATNYTSLQWTSTGSGTLTNANTLTPSYLPDAADAANGTVVLRLTAQPIAPCASTVFDEITLTIEMEPTADAGSDATVCEGDNYSLTGASATNYVSIAWTTTGTGIFSNSSLVTPTYFPSIADYAAGSIDLTMTVTGNAACGTTATSTMTMTFTPDATADAGVDATICETSYYTISSANATNYISLNWTHNGSGSIINAGTLTPQYTPSAADIIAGTVTLTLNATGAGTCGTITDQMVLTITKQPTVSTGADASVCEGNTYSVINALAQNYNTITWTTSGTGAFSNSGIINPVYTPSSADIAAGAVIITLTATPNTPCGTDIQDFFVLVIEPASVANAGPDASVCEGNSFAVAGSSAQNANSINWTSSGNGSFVNETTLNPTYTPGTNDIILGTVTLTINTIGNSPCGGDSDDMILSIQNLPTANAGADGSVCVGNDYSLVTTSATNYSIISWTTSGDGTFVNGNTLTPDYTPGPNDIVNGSAALTLNATASAPCLGPISDAMNLTITAEPTAYAGIDSTICFGDIYNITNATTSDYASLVWTTSGSGTFINNGTIAPTYFPSGPDRASGSVIITLVAYPSSPCATLATDAFVLSFEEGPVVFAGAATNICEGDNYVNTDATASGYNSLLWTSTGTGSFVDATIVNTTYIPSATDIATGVVTLTFTAIGNGSCTQDSDNLTITINTSPTADAGTLSEICSSPTIITGATATYYSSLSWTSSGSGSFINGGTLTPTYTPSASEIAAGTAILTLTATPIGGCGVDAISSIPITIKQAPIVYAGADASTCLGSNYTISDATESNSTSLLWTTNGTGTFTDPSIANPTYTPSAFDETLGAVTLTLTGSSSSCSDHSDQMILTINTISPTVDAGTDATICEGTSYPIGTAAAQDYNTITWTTSGTGAFSNANIINPIYTPTSADIIAGAVLITLTATPDNACGNNIDDSFILTFEAASVAYAGADGNVCEGNDYILVNATAANSASVHWTTSGDGAFSDENILEPTYTPGTNDILLGNVDLTITTTGNSPCSGDSDDMTLDIQKLPTVNAGADASVCVGNNYTIVASSATNFGALSWRTSGDGSFVGGNTLNPVYTPGANDIINGSVLLTIDASSAAPCVGPVSDEMDLNIVSEPTAFSGIDTTICFGEIYDVTNAIATNYFSLVWVSSGTGTIINNGTLTPTYTPSAQDRTLGSTVLTLTANPLSPCALPVVSSFILSFREGPVAEAGASVDICEGDNYTNTDAVATDYISLLWTSSGTGSFVDATIEQPTYIPSATDISTGVVTLTMTATGDGSCAIDIDDVTITINKSPTADAGTLTEICSSPTIVTGATASDYDILSWMSSGGGTFVNGASLTPTYTPSASEITAGTAIITLTATPIGGCGVPAVSSIPITINQAAIVYAGADAITCLSSPYTISDATASNHTSLLWSTSGTGSFSDPTVINPTYTPSVADEALGSVTLTLTGLSSSCADEENEMILTINTISPTVDAGPDAHICEGNTFPIVNASALDYNTITWSTSGTGIFTNSSIINPVYTPSAADLASGAVLITLTATPNTPCGTTEDDSFILSFEAASIAYAGADAPVCEGNDYILTEATAQHTTAINWISSGDGSFSNQTLLNPTYTPGTNDIILGSVTLTINTTGNTPCGGYSDELILSIQKLPTADAGADANICAGNNYVFVSPTATNYSAISWTPSGDGSFTNGNTLTPTYTPGPNDILNGSVTLTLNATSSAPCIGPISDEMILNVISDPTVYSGIDTTICFGDTYEPINATATDYASLAWTSSGTGTFFNGGTIAPTYFSSPADRASGSIVITLTANPLSPCALAVSDAFVLSFIEGPVVEAGAATSICETDSYTNGDANITGVYTSLLWTSSGTGTFIDATVENTTYNPSIQDIFNGAVTLTLTAQGDGSCAEASDYVTITINKSPSISAGTMTEICSSPSTIVGASGSNYSSVLWSSSGDGVFINETSLTPTYITGTNDQLNGSVILTITAQPKGGCGVQAVNSIVVTIKDAPVVSAGSDGFVCFGSSYTITDATESFTSDVFWISNGNGTFNDPTLLFPTYTPGTLDAANGVATLSITGLSSSCVDHVDLMVLTINSTVPSVYAGQDTSVCANDSYTVNDALFSNYDNLVWTHNGFGTLANPTTATPTYTPNVADIGNTITLSVDAIATTPCASTITDVLLLEVKAIPTANAGGPVTICEGSTYQFVGSLATNYESLSWSTTGTGTFLNANSYLPEYIPSAADYANGSVIIRLTVSNGPCTDVYNEMILSFSQPAVIDAGNNATVDIGASFTVTTATSSDLTASFLWTSSGTGTFTLGTDITLGPTYTPSALDFANGSVLLTLSATGAAPCSNAVTDYMILTVTDHPPVDFYWVSSCSGDNTEFLIDDVVTDLGSIATYAWDFGDGNTYLSTLPNDASNAYGTSGLYTVTLTATDTAGYTNIVWHYVDVDQAPLPNYSYDQPACSGFTTLFTDHTVAPSGYIVEWHWDFGDGNDTTIYSGGNPNVEYTYANSGTFATSLTVLTSDSCSNAKLINVEITTSPIASFTHDNACFGNITAFTDLSQEGDNIDIVSWEWDFGELTAGLNNYSSEQNAIHQYMTTGDFPVSLTVTNARGCSHTAVDTVTINVPPALDFTYSAVCFDTPIQFTVDTAITDIPNITDWFWDFGDNNTSTDRDPEHVYAVSGTYTVSLTVLDVNSCSSTISYTLDVIDLPVANFHFDNPTCEDNMVQFNDYSYTPATTTITEWEWIFGDGDTTIVTPTDNPNVQHLYDTSGVFTVNLLITNSNGCTSSLSKVVTILPPPIADFSSTVTCLNEFVQFTDESLENGSGNIISWEWDFGDPDTGINNNSSSLQNPVHQFSTAGIYTIFLQIENVQGCTDTISQDITINELPAVDFNIYDACLGSDVRFSIDSTISDIGAIASYYWDYGDGNNSNNRDTTSHSYLASGTYTVILSISDTAGCVNSVSHEITIASLPLSIFSTSASQCISDPIQFNDLSTNEDGYIAEWHWDFGDGNDTIVSFGDNPNLSHLYESDGIYTATLTVTNSNGCVGVSTQDITILPGPLARFDFESVCLNVSADFIDLSDPNGGGQIIDWNWTFGDPTSGVDNNSTLQNPSHIFNTIGDHEVTLTVANENGCSSTYFDTINISMLPEIDFTTIGGNCIDGVTEFVIDTSLVDTTQIRTIVWDFGDGQTVTNPPQPTTHVYPISGTYQITLTLIDINDCVNSITKDVEINPLPDVNFDTDAPSCNGNETQFTDLSLNTSAIDIWYWEFGDGTDTTIIWDENISQHPIHTYDTIGTYLARLTITTNEGCSNSFEKEITITPTPRANFFATTTCINYPAQFTDRSSVNGGTIIVDRYWDFGDPHSDINNNSTQENPVHQYAVSGTYEVSLTITNAEGCQDTYSDSLIVTLPPVLDPFTFSSNICENSLVEFSMSTNVNLMDVQTILWDFGDPNSADNTSDEQNPTHWYDTPGEYTVTLSLDNDNCGGSIDTVIIVNARPQSVFEVENACFGQSTIFTDYSIHANPIEWLWDFGVLTRTDDTSTVQNPTYIYPELGSDTIRLTIIDSNGCSDTSSQVITIMESPISAFSYEDNFEDTQGRISLLNESEGATEYEWIFGDGGLSFEENPVHSYTEDGNYDIDLISFNQYNCSDTSTQEYGLIFKGLFIPNAFSPNNPNADVAEFKAVGINLKSYKIEVFDSWGNLIWESTALEEGVPSESWDGTFKNTNVPIGVYIWKASGLFEDDTIWEGRDMGIQEGGSGKTFGTVTLIR